MKDPIQIENARIWTDKGILFYEIRNNEIKRKLKVETLKKYIQVADELCQGSPMPFLIDLRFTKGAFFIAAAKLLANSPKLKSIRISEAFVVNSIGTRLIVLSYKRIYNPITPFVIVDTF